jgi:hypothetical protein
LSSSDDGPSSPTARLAALAAEFYATAPQPGQLAYSQRLRRHTQNFPPSAVGRMLAPLFADRGYVQRVAVASTEAERRTVAKVCADDPARADAVPTTTLADRVAAILCHLPEPPEGVPYAIKRAADAARDLGGHGGSVRWVREVAVSVAAALPALADRTPVPVLYRDGEPEPGPATVSRTASRREYLREYRAKSQPRRSDLATAAGWVLAWRESVKPGAHKTSTVHRLYHATIVSGGESRDVRPVARTQFHAIASHDDALGQPVRRASGRHYVVQEATNMTKEERRNLALLIVDKLADEFREDVKLAFAEIRDEREGAAPVTAPAATDHAHVVSLDSRRRARRAA